MATTQYQEGMAFYIREDVPIDPWGRTILGHPDFEVEPEETYEESEASEDSSDVNRESDRYDDMTAEELKEELRQRHEAGREIDVTGVRRKAELAKKLREDDVAQEQQG